MVNETNPTILELQHKLSIYPFIMDGLKLNTDKYKPQDKQIGFAKNDKYLYTDITISQWNKMDIPQKLFILKNTSKQLTNERKTIKSLTSYE